MFFYIHNENLLLKFESKMYSTLRFTRFVAQEVTCCDGQIIMSFVIQRIPSLAFVIT